MTQTTDLIKIQTISHTGIDVKELTPELALGYVVNEMLTHHKWLYLDNEAILSSEDVTLDMLKEADSIFLTMLIIGA